MRRFPFVLLALAAWLIPAALLADSLGPADAEEPVEEAPEAQPAPAGPAIEDLETFAGVLSRLETFYVDDVPREELIRAALRGIFDHLDLGSQYLAPEEFDRFVEEVQGEYAGIGIRIEPEERGLRIVDVFEGGPAAAAGLAAGDLITEVEGTSMAGTDGIELPVAIRGPVGTQVRLTIERDEEVLDLSVKRAPVHPPAVRSGWLEPGYGWIKLYEFQERSAREMGTHLSELRSEGLTALVLDLRDNPGGSLAEAVAMADMFLDEGIIVSTRGRDGYEHKERAKRVGTVRDLPVIVLLNKNSASASEVLAGALRDHDRAVLVGETSFGKGTVQQIFPLDNGGGAKITVARYYLPGGTTVDKVGLTPDVAVPDGGRDKLAEIDDPELAGAAEALFERLPDMPDDLRLAVARVLLEPAQGPSDVARAQPATDEPEPADRP